MSTSPPNKDTYSSSSSNSPDHPSAILPEQSLATSAHQLDQSEQSNQNLAIPDQKDSLRGLLVTAPKIHRRRRESGGSTGSDTSVTHEGSRPRSSSNTSIASEPVGQGCGSLRSGQSIRRTASDRQLRRSGSERALRKHDDSGTLRRFGSGEIPTGKTKSSGIP